jgi:hypothetical protein
MVAEPWGMTGTLNSTEVAPLTELHCCVMASIHFAIDAVTRGWVGERKNSHFNTKGLQTQYHKKH